MDKGVYYKWDDLKRFTEELLKTANMRGRKWNYSSKYFGDVFYSIPAQGAYFMICLLHKLEGALVAGAQVAAGVENCVFYIWEAYCAFFEELVAFW